MTLYKSIAILHYERKEYSEAISYFCKAFGTQEKISTTNPEELATLDNMGEYSDALFYYNRALGIENTSVPDNHPSLATTHMEMPILPTEHPSTQSSEKQFEDINEKLEE